MLVDGFVRLCGFGTTQLNVCAPPETHAIMNPDPFESLSPSVFAHLDKGLKLDDFAEFAGEEGVVPDVTVEDAADAVPIEVCGVAVFHVVYNLDSLGDCRARYRERERNDRYINAYYIYIYIYIYAYSTALYASVLIIHCGHPQEAIDDLILAA